MNNIVNGLTTAFNNFLINISNGGQWTYIFIGLIIFIIILNILCEMTRRCK